MEVSGLVWHCHRAVCPERILFLGRMSWVHSLPCGIDLDSLPVSRPALFHLSAKHLIPPKHPFAFPKYTFSILHVYFLPLSLFLSLHFSFVLIYVYIFTRAPTLLYLPIPLPPSCTAASLFSPPIKHSLGPPAAPGLCKDDAWWMCHFGKASGSCLEQTGGGRTSWEIFSLVGRVTGRRQ